MKYISIIRIAYKRKELLLILGIIIELKWTDHINYTRNKILKSIGILYKYRPFLNKRTSKKLWHRIMRLSKEN